jgi:D-3-phosphoglycerate dehydrogenase
MSRILVAEPVAQEGLDILVAAHETSVRLNLPRAGLLEALREEGGWDALVVRSQTRVDAELLTVAAPRVAAGMSTRSVPTLATPTTLRRGAATVSSSASTLV